MYQKKLIERRERQTQALNRQILNETSQLKESKKRHHNLSVDFKQDRLLGKEKKQVMAHAKRSYQKMTQQNRLEFEDQNILPVLSPNGSHTGRTSGEAMKKVQNSSVFEKMLRDKMRKLGPLEKHSTEYRNTQRLVNRTVGQVGSSTLMDL